MREELKPCPFCGGKAIRFESNGGFWYRCDECKAESGFYYTDEEATEAWNRRTNKKKARPTCPKWLEPEAKKEWRRLAKQIDLTDVDMSAFASYCQAYARWKEAEEFLTQYGTAVKTPSGYWQTAPQVSIAQIYNKIMIKLATEFGLTPSSRSQTKISQTESLSV